jgi:hypothetical protein
MLSWRKFAETACTQSSSSTVAKVSALFTRIILHVPLSPPLSCLLPSVPFPEKKKKKKKLGSLSALIFYKERLFSLSSHRHLHS